MPRIDLRIEFDRPDRTYRPGGHVRGAVLIDVHGDVGTADLVIEPSWRAHGKGNTHKVPARPELLGKGPWREGETQRVPFSVPTPEGPPSYAGHHFDVEHSLRARLNVRWGLDVKVREDFVLLPGSQATRAQPRESDDVELVMERVRTLTAILGAGLMLAAFVVGLPPGPLLFPVGVGLAYFGVQRKLVGLKLGGVHVTWGSLTVAPEDEVPVQVRLTPSKRVPLNGVNLSLVCTESCTKGGGKNSKTYKHVVYRALFNPDAPEVLPGGVTSEIQGVARIPSTPAYSLEAGRNKVTWKLEMRVDVPNWPDWVASRQLVVVPREQLHSSSAAPELEPSEREDAPPPESQLATAPVAPKPIPMDSPTPQALPEEQLQPEVLDEPVDAEPVQTPAEPVEVPAPSEPSAADTQPSELVAILMRLDAIEGYGRERDDLISGLAQSAYDCDLDVERVERTYTPKADRFRSGRTLTGTVRGTSFQVSVQLPESENQLADALAKGSPWQGRCTPEGWNLIHRRVDMLAAE